MSAVIDDTPPLIRLTPTPGRRAATDLVRLAFQAHLARGDGAVHWALAHPEAPEDLLLELCERGEYLNELGHRTSPQTLVEKMASKYRYPEAVVTLGKRYYTDPAVPESTFRQFLTEHSDLPWLFESLARETADPESKEQALTAVAGRLPVKGAVQSLMSERDQERRATRTADLAEIGQLYQLGEPRVWRALAANPKTPEAVVRELLAVKGTKYAREIRARAAENLSRRKQS
jgi:hypothetical protein